MDEDEEDLEQQGVGEQDQSQLGQDEPDDGLVTGSGNQSEEMPPPIPFDGTEGFSASASNDMPPPISFDDMPPPPIPFTEAEGLFQANMRELAHGIVPMAASLPYMGIGATMGAVGGPIGAGIGAVIGGGIGAYVASQAQEAILDATGTNDKEQRAANLEAHGHGLLPGELGSALIGFKPGALADSLAKRVLSGGVMGTIEGVQNYAETGTVDPVRVAAGALTGAALPDANRFGARMQGAFVPRNTAGHYVPGQTPGEGVEPPAFDAETDVKTAARSENVKTGVGTAQEQAAPNENVTGVGNEGSAPTRSERLYEKRRAAKLAAQEEIAPDGLTQLQEGEIPQDVRAALETSKPSRQDQVPENPGFDWVRGEPSDGQDRYHPGDEGVPSGEPTPGPADVSQGSVGQPRRPQDFVERRVAPRGNPEDAAITQARMNREAEQRVHDRIAAEQVGADRVPQPETAQRVTGRGRVEGYINDPALQTGIDRLRGRSDGRVLEDLRRPETPEPRGRDLTGEGSGGMPSQAELHGEPRKPRILEDLTRPLTERAQNEQAPGLEQPTEKPGSKSIKEFQTERAVLDSKGNVVAYARNVGLANKRTNMLRIAADTMAKFGDRFAKDINVKDGKQVEELRALAREAVAHARENGWTRYMPRQEKEGAPHLQAPPEALWMDEVAAFGGSPKVNKTTGDVHYIRAKRDNRRYDPADFIARERLLRSGQEDATQQVRDDRFDQGDRAKKRFTPGDVTGDGNLDANPVHGEDVVLGDGSRHKALRSGKLSEMFDPTETDMIGGKFQGTYREVARSVIAQDPNVRTHVVSDEVMDTYSRDRIGFSADGFYDPDTHTIVVRESAAPDTMLHEAVHAVTSRKLDQYPEMRALVQRFMNSLPGLEKHKYEMSSPKEFLANGMSNPRFQAALADIELHPSTAEALGLGKGTIVDGFKAFVHIVRKILGLKEGQYTALEGVIKLTSDTMRLPDRSSSSPQPFGKRGQLDAAVQQVRQQGDEITKQMKAPWGLKLRDMDKIARASDPLFGGADKNPIRVIHSAIERARVKSLKYFHADEDLHKEMWDLRAKDPKAFSDLEQLMQLESMHQRYGDLPVNKQGFNTNDGYKAQRDAAHPDLEARWNALPADLKDLRAKLYDYADTRHNAISDTLAANRLEKLLGVDDPALAKRVMDGTHDAADFRRLGKDDRERQSRLELLQDIGGREKVVGPYTPFIRRGKYAVTGLYKVKDTGNELRKIDDNTREFANKADAEDFATQQNGATKVVKYYVDKTTGLPHADVTTPVTDRRGAQAQDPAGRDLEYEKAVRFTKEDMQTNPNIEERWKATVERGYLKMTDTKADANTHAQELLDTKDFDHVDRQPRRYNPHTDAVTLASNFTNLEGKLKHNVVYQNMNAKEQQAVRELLSEHYLQSLTATRSTNTKMHRNYVKGADEDLVRNMIDYSADTGARLARLEQQPALDAARDKAGKMVNADTVHSAGRQKVLNEIDARLDHMKDDFFSLASGQMGPAMHRLMSWSYTARLATPGFTIRNLTQLPMMTGAEVGGRHGFGATYREMLKTYKELGAGKTLWGGIKDTGKAAAGKLDKPTTFVEDIKSRLTDPREKELIDHLVADGSLDPDAGFQIAEFAKRGEGVNLDWGGADKKNALMKGTEAALTKADKALHWVEEVSRQLPRAAETINRGHTGVIAYRLEFRKLTREGMAADAAHEKAMQYATDVVDNTQFRYTDTNKPTWQRNPFARAAFQFKQFGKSTYEFMGRHLATAIDKQASPEDRTAARKSLGAMFVSHTLVAGALGLPWEPVRALLIGAKAGGITSYEWDDVENGIREALTGLGNLAGFNEKTSKKMAEAFARGMPRLLGMDFSPGLGIDNMLLFGSPRSGQDRELDTNLAAWMFQMAGGAPGSLVMQMLHGLRDVAGGDYAAGIEKLSPLKVVSDVVKAEEGYRHGKQNARGRETMAPYSATEAVTKAMGIPVAREAEQGAYAHQVYQKGQEIKTAKSNAISEWIKADPENKGAAYQKAIAAGLAPKDLTAAASRERTTRQRSVNGVPVNRDTRPIAERLRKVYNTGD